MQLKRTFLLVAFGLLAISTALSEAHSGGENQSEENQEGDNNNDVQEGSIDEMGGSKGEDGDSTMQDLPSKEGNGGCGGNKGKSEIAQQRNSERKAADGGKKGGKSNKQAKKQQRQAEKKQKQAEKKLNKKKSSQ